MPPVQASPIYSILQEMDRIIGRTGMEYRETSSKEIQMPD